MLPSSASVQQAPFGQSLADEKASRGMIVHHSIIISFFLACYTIPPNTSCQHNWVVMCLPCMTKSHGFEVEHSQQSKECNRDYEVCTLCRAQRLRLGEIESNPKSNEAGVGGTRLKRVYGSYGLKTPLTLSQPLPRLSAMIDAEDDSDDDEGEIS